jgi:hypothetical protein
MKILKIKHIIVFLFVKAAFLLYDVHAGLPPSIARKNLKKQTKSLDKDLAKDLEDKLVTPLAKRIVKKIHLKPRKKVELEQSLSRIGIDDTAEMYTAKAVSYGLLGLLMPLVCFASLGFDSFVILTFGFPLGLLLYNLTKHKGRIKKKTKELEGALPAFIRAIVSRIGVGEREVMAVDLIGIFEEYLRVAPEVFEYDLQMLVMEMKSTNEENGLNNFARRVRLNEVDQMVQALIGITRGEPQREVLASIAREMEVRHEVYIDEQYKKRPKKVIIATIPVFVCAILITLYAFGSVALSGMVSLF